MLRRALRVLALLVALAAPAGCDPGTSIEEGCRVREDCPRPDRQTCQVETGVCVGFTSEPGDTDGGAEEADGGADGGT